MTTDGSRGEIRHTAARMQSTLGRRRFVAGASGLAAALAGCLGSDPDGGTDDGGSTGDDETDHGDGDDARGGDGNDGIETEDDGAVDGSDEATREEGEATTTSAPFRLLISDMPADIDDFERLTVSLDRARIFKTEETDTDDEEDPGENDEDDVESDRDDDEEQAGDDGDEEADGGDDETADDDADEDGETESDDPTDDSAAGIERNRGFFVLDLDGQSVDLTDVVGDKAVPVFEGELDEGRYTKIELHVRSVAGVVDGEEAEVKIPSEKLQITHPFELRADEPVDFVFDINVVRRGRGNRYNLTPVISESGVASEDVAVEEIPDVGDTDDGDSEPADDGDESDEANGSTDDEQDE